ncbi:YolD-like family protein [Metabacillus arenae]|uniref:YolD-like family protein n=1 Tax=Metabacillus arenae TaxID=2771434 RepID=A0A926NEF0_9BACI|nr:YolD-like family protein [Metabacillus arenae]MBD1381974.1 YolD-like family protein [Metabacillus arenae]
MILKELRKNRYITVNYFENGLLKSCDGQVWNLNLYEQSLTLKDKQQKEFSIQLSKIKAIS